MASCNSKSASYEDLEMYNSSTAVTAFSIKPNKKVMAHLDSVYFAIDLENAVIFNPDSLPKGTDVRALVAEIKYPDAVTGAVVEMYGGSYRTGEVDYFKNPGDSIDFTGRVTLRLTAYDGHTRDYTLKVNVHRMEPDSIVWTALADRTLPSRMASPANQKTVGRNGSTFCLIRESDGTTTLSSTASHTMDDWQKTAVTLPDNADIRSFTATGDAFWILAGGDLYTSSDGMQWTVAADCWETLLGAFGESVLGISRHDDGSLWYVRYPDNGFASYPMDADFPLHDGSNLCEFHNKWATEPIAFFAGGTDCRGNVCSAVWGFDGDIWTQMSLTPPPALTGATIVPYYVYIQTTAMWVQTEISAWVMLGGRNADGTLNRDVYVSYDTGVNWRKAPQLMQLPQEMGSFCFADQVVATSPYSGNLSDAWKTRSNALKAPSATRIIYDVDGYEVNWECPFIYIFGGRDDNDALRNRILRGVLSRMTFIPII